MLNLSAGVMETLNLTSVLNNNSPIETLNSIDCAWILICSFLIITMQTGFALLECGCVSIKSTTNIMMKNLIDMVSGGLSYWMFGFALSFGTPSNWFCGYGDFFLTVDSSTEPMGTYATYFFQLSFASTAATIVSGAAAERMKLYAYMLFSFLNTASYCIGASWVWNTGDGVKYLGGFLYRLNYFDFAGVSVVHLKGGVSAFIAAAMLGPRKGRFTHPHKFQMNSPVTALTGLFMLWWSWLAFNCGSTFSVSGQYWKITALVAVTTINGSIGGGFAGVTLSLLMKWGKIDVAFLVNSILGGLVAITGIAPVISPWEALIVGFIGGLLAVGGIYAMEALKIDDPVGAVPVHMVAAVWGTVAVGLFGKNNIENQLNGFDGLFHGGGWYLLGVQVLGCLCVTIWSAVTTFIFLLAMNTAIGIRITTEEEISGADWAEHQVMSMQWMQKLEKALDPITPEEFSRVVKLLVWELPSENIEDSVQHMGKSVLDPMRDGVVDRGRIRTASLFKRSNKTRDTGGYPNLPSIDETPIRND